MCGIIFLVGPNAEPKLTCCLKKISHRGPDETNFWSQSERALGFTRLAVNGQGVIGRQPYQDGDWVGTVNGEIYNYQELISQYNLLVADTNDTQVLLPLFIKLGAEVLDVIDGFYAAVLYNKVTEDIVLLRDRIGKKPLFYGRSKKECFITSELKAIENIDWFKQVPKGITHLNLANWEVDDVVAHPSIFNTQTKGYDIRAKLYEAVKKRLPLTQPVGLFLSGGLDSSILAYIASNLQDDITYFTLGSPNSSDSLMANKVIKALQLKNVQHISIPSGDLLERYIEKVVYITESYNPSIVSNGLATYLLAEAVKSLNIKVALTGEGADELFGGYFTYLEPQKLQMSMERLLADMHFTELRRLDLCTMAHGVEARCPFLDREILKLSHNIRFEDIYFNGANKAILRSTYKEILPQEIINRPKVSFDVGSGIREVVVSFLRRNGKSEREELKSIWSRYYFSRPQDAYFDSYPAFDTAIDQRGSQHR
ncbi:asparagine synthetase B family protein [Shewanella frigidimarina]|uniref:asparagine synthase (glutamine-hydrolyzing) n=1 Tax=Shewanella frigidimarina TaxID=56812 RepID=A0A119D0K2_SHEFR|nr:asparagine synthase-related protein [Shewanella frigidimarina]KVX03052.1 hypothetical protein AWJ07_00280 [Shewanella frigidimarina]